MEIKIIYEDDDLMAVDKPAGMIVNRAETTKGIITLQEWAEERLGIKNYETLPGDDFISRAGIVHRLDKETSGILLIAKNAVAFAEMQKQFKTHTVRKKYITLVHGKVMQQEGFINAPVGRLSWNRRQFGVTPGGRESKTNYKVIAYYQFPFIDMPMSLLEVYPETGRTHQIRVHLKYIGHPVFSDFLYAGRKTARSDRKYLDRVFLHAAYINFNQPVSGRTVIVESELPDDLVMLLNQGKII